MTDAGPMSAPNTRPWLSVVIPAHEDGHWLVHALESLAAQTRRDFECILVDSSADDGVARIAERFAERMPIRVERRPDLVGWQRKTNHGVALARAAHVSTLHPDDLWEPHRAEAVHGWLTARPDDVLHLHPCWIVDDRGRRLSRLRCPLPIEADIAPAIFLDRLIVQNFISVCAPVVRRDVFLAAGGFDPALWYTGDWDLYLKLGRLGSVRYHAEPLAGYRVHASAMTMSGSRRAEEVRHQYATVVQRHLALFDERDRRRLAGRVRASVEVNIALAAALNGSSAGLLAVVSTLGRLGPAHIAPFLRDTRLIERVLPRVRTFFRPALGRKLRAGLGRAMADAR